MSDEKEAAYSCIVEYDGTKIEVNTRYLDGKSGYDIVVTTEYGQRELWIPWPLASDLASVLQFLYRLT